VGRNAHLSGDIAKALGGQASELFAFPPRFGRIDVLINNVGVFIPKPFTEYTTDDFNTLVSTTLAGFLYVSQPT
jgi:NAD(P)-dependent dehydrogenase (short-subunit alcohol dehydrogenase family)